MIREWKNQLLQHNFLIYKKKSLLWLIPLPQVWLIYFMIKYYYDIYKKAYKLWIVFNLIQTYVLLSSLKEYIYWLFRIQYNKIK